MEKRYFQPSTWTSVDCDSPDKVDVWPRPRPWPQQSSLLTHRGIRITPTPAAGFARQSSCLTKAVATALLTPRSTPTSEICRNWLSLIWTFVAFWNFVDCQILQEEQTSQQQLSFPIIHWWSVLHEEMWADRWGTLAWRWMRCCSRAKAILLIKQLGKLVLEVVDQVVIPNVLRSAFPLMSFMLTSVVCILVVFNISRCFWTLYLCQSSETCVFTIVELSHN